MTSRDPWPEPKSGSFLERLATPMQWMAFWKRLRKPRTWVEALAHFGMGAGAWFPPVLVWILVREQAQATTGDPHGRPSRSTGWLDPLFDDLAYAAGLASSAALGLWLIFR